MIPAVLSSIIYLQRSHWHSTTLTQSIQLSVLTYKVSHSCLWFVGVYLTCCSNLRFEVRIQRISKHISASSAYLLFGFATINDRCSGFCSRVHRGICSAFQTSSAHRIHQLAPRIRIFLFSVVFQMFCRAKGKKTPCAVCICSLAVYKVLCNEFRFLRHNC